MSGGSFNYAYSRLNDFADEAEAKVAENGVPDEVLAEMRQMSQEARSLAKRMRAAEWLYSGDISEETFLKWVAER